MDKKLFSPFPILFIATIFSVAFLSLFTGCCIFGGGGKEALQTVETPPAKPTPPAVSQPETSKPIPAAIPPTKSRFQTDEFDDEVKMVNGSLNWSKGVIRATGYGVPPDNAVNASQGKLLAFTAARAEAYAALLEVTKGVQVTATTTVENHMVKDHTIDQKVEGVIKGAVEIKREFQEKDQTAGVELGIFLEDVAKSISTSALPPETAVLFTGWEPNDDETLRRLAGENEKLQNLIGETSENLDEMKQKLEEMAEENKKLVDKDKELLATIEDLKKEIKLIGYSKEIIEPEKSYTGIVINAAGSGIKRCMAPNIYYKSGDTPKLLYGANDGRERGADLKVLVQWVKTLDKAQAHSRVTKDPFIIEAIGLAEEQSALVISADYAMIIEKINEKSHLLENGKVVIVR
jgi:hypothetical protein